MLSLIHVLEWRAVVTPDTVALTDHLGAELSYADLAARTEAHASQYAAAGLGPGDVVPILARNQAAWVTAMTGLIRAGALPAAVNWRLAPAEITALLSLLRPAAIVADVDCAAAASQAALAMAEPVPILEMIDDPPAVPDAGPSRPVDQLRGSEPAILLPAGRRGIPSWRR